MDCFNRLLTNAEFEGQMKDFQFGNEGLSVNHLQFANDIILFSNLPHVSSIKNMIKIVKTFESFSGQNINLQKVEIVGINVSIKLSKTLPMEYGCKKGEWPNMYLGLPLKGIHISFSFWKTIVKK